MHRALNCIFACALALLMAGCGKSYEEAVSLSPQWRAQYEKVKYGQQINAYDPTLQAFMIEVNEKRQASRVLSMESCQWFIKHGESTRWKVDLDGQPLSKATCSPTGPNRLTLALLW